MRSRKGGFPMAASQARFIDRTMSKDLATRPEFERLLAAEVERILGDPLFQRSPVLSRLLVYLRDQSLNPDAPPTTQFSIAVDGLGRREDYDQDAESYVRVQISRLRKSLADYYTRHQPFEELCVVIRHGEYALRLAPIERAYPEQHSGRASASPADEVAIEDGNGEKAQHNSASVPFLSIFAVAAALVAIWATFSYLPGWLQGPPPISGPPRVSVTIEGDGEVSTGEDFEDLAPQTNLAIRKAIASSVITRGGSLGESSYDLWINLSAGTREKPEAFLRLTNADDFVLFADTISISGGQERFASDLTMALEAVFSAAGVIAMDLNERFEDRAPETAFECFLRIESARSIGLSIDSELDRCMTQFADSQYAAYWLARRGFIEYQTEAFAGNPIERGSGGWDNLVAALSRDRYNYFANALAAKVELASGNCEQAKVYVERAVERSVTNPGLNVSVIVDALPCFDDREVASAAYKETLSDLIARHPDPDSVLRLYLVFAALELGRTDKARELLRSGIANAPGEGGMARTFVLLKQALGLEGEGKASAADMAELRKWVGQYFWNPKSQDAILGNISAS